MPMYTCAVKGVVLLKPEALGPIIELFNQHKNQPDQLDNNLMYLYGINSNFAVESHFRNKAFADPTFNYFDIERGCISFISGFDESKLSGFLKAVAQVSSSYIIYSSAEDKFRVDNLTYHIKSLDELNHRTSDFVNLDIDIEYQAFDFSAVNGSGEYFYRDTSQFPDYLNKDDSSAWIKFYKMDYKGLNLYNDDNDSLSIIGFGTTGAGKSLFNDLHVIEH